ncbi:dynamin family protein [Fusobacterium periodonticum]|uniref:Helix-turn-helix containing protein n=1 Tax=Fusobacterium periodonticum 1_1_41FAA TaxID=469621 RepID=D6LFJ7_9FUSO|nr:dynamin family protein [Fusobacterium periodonticum]EFG28932.1 DNA-binding helix-turn-helix protein [Fusobacterium periodonticum 1_1_41FAA]
MSEFNLKNFRENYLKLTQAELAELIGVRQDRISRLEQNLDSISLEELVILSKKTGKSLDEITNYKKNVINKLEVKDSWSKVRYIKNTVINYIKDYSPKNNLNYENKIENLRRDIEGIARKPRIVFSGKSDSGKSTMINALLGKEKMPTNWTPTTSIIVYVKDILDRPAYMEEELWIFKKGKNKEWDDTRLYDEKYCREWKVAGGNAEMLSQYGVRKGEEYNKDIGSAVLFIDSPILKNCDILDIPGITAGIESDNIAASQAKLKADVLVYLSQASGFLQTEDANYLKEALEVLPPLEKTEGTALSPMSNLFVVATHAHHVIPRTDLKKICDSGCNRFTKTLPESFWERYSNSSKKLFSEKDLRKRFFTYTTDIEDLREDFEKELKNTIENLPKLLENKIFNLAKDYAKNESKKMSDEVIKYEKLINERDAYSKRLEDIKKNEPKRKFLLEENNRNVKNKIFDLDSETKKKFREDFNQMLTEENIVKIIDRREYKNKKADLEELGSYISSEVQDIYRKNLEKTTEKFKDTMDEYLVETQKSLELANNSNNMNINLDFDFKSAFIGGLAGAATLGGLAFWASTLGNLGAYILVAKGVSVLSALGISIAGGTATATAFVASIGGPITLGIAAALLVGVAIWGFFSDSWKKKIAKKIIEEIKKSVPKYEDAITQYWLDTENGFDIAKNKMEEEWEKYINNLENELYNYDINKLKENLRNAKEVKDFFTNIPL